MQAILFCYGDICQRFTHLRGSNLTNVLLLWPVYHTYFILNQTHCLRTFVIPPATCGLVEFSLSLLTVYVFIAGQGSV